MGEGVRGLAADDAVGASGGLDRSSGSEVQSHNAILPHPGGCPKRNVSSANTAKTAAAMMNSRAPLFQPFMDCQRWRKGGWPTSGDGEGMA